MDIARTVAAALFVLSVAACASEPPLPPKAAELNRLGAAALAAGDLQVAEARVSLAIEYSPKFTEAWVNLGLIELARGDVKPAMKHLAHARKLNPDLPTPHHAIALLEEKAGRTRAAEGSYRAALAVDPGFAPARVNLGRLLFASGRMDEAREQFLRLTEVAPGTIEGWVGLAEALLRLGRERDSDRVVSLARARFGDLPPLSLLVARQLMRRGAFDDAADAFARLTSDGDPHRRATAWAWLAVARLANGKDTDASVAVEESLAADPGEPVARFVYARLAHGPTATDVSPLP